MPALPSWHARVEEILAALAEPGAPPVLDRQALETLFQVRRRQAIRLMAHFGGYQAGKTFLVERAALVAGLDQLVASGAAGHATARKQRILAAVNEVSQRAAARRALVPIDPEIRRRQPHELAAAIDRLAPGRLEIRYHGAEDLLAQIAELAAAAANDYAGFRRRFESGVDGEHGENGFADNGEDRR
jgi:hypothetical protein